MADKKKVYSIVINGLQESVGMVESLNAQLKELDKTIKAVEKRTIKIKGEVEMADIPEQKVVVGGGSAGSSSAEKEKLSDKELAIQKQITAEKKAQAQLDAMQTEEYQKSYTAMSQTKDAIKQSKQELEAMASGAATLTQNGLQYSNTMKGMKAELKNLKTIRDSLDLAKPEEVERFKEIQERALELETLLKSIESEAGVFSRNVGNYPQLLKQATTEWENVQKIITSLSDKLSKATPGTEGYDKLKSELEQAEKYAKALDDRLGEIKSNINEVNQTGIKIDVGGKEREFNSLRDAVKTLTQELSAMTLAGEENSKEFEVTIEALGRVKTAISQTTGEINSYIGGAKALNDTIEIMQGLSGLASIGVGLQGLFGGVNEETDEALRKFAQLTLVMQGLANEQKAIQDGTSIWGNALKSTWEWLDKIGNIKLFGKWGPSINGVIDSLKKATNTTKSWVDQLNAAVGFKDFSKLAGNLDNLSAKISVEFDKEGTTEKVKQQLTEMQRGLNDILTLKLRYEADQKGIDSVMSKLDGVIKNAQDDIDELNKKKIDIQLSGGSEEEIAKIDEEIQGIQSGIQAIEGQKIELTTGDSQSELSDLEITIKNIDESLKNLDKNDPNAKKYKELAEQFKEVASEAVNAQKSTTGVAAFLGRIPVLGKAAAIGLNAVSVALKTVATSVKAVAKATIILAVVQAAFEVLEPVIEAVGNAARAVFGIFGKGIDIVKSFFGAVGTTANQTKDSVDSLNVSLEQTEDRLNKFNKQVDRLQKAGVLNNVDAGALKLQKLGLTASQSGLELQKFITTVDNLDKALKDNLGAIGSWYEIWTDSESIDGFLKRWDTLRKAVEAGTDELKQETGEGSFWYTASDAVDDFADANKAMLQDLSDAIQKIDFSKPETAVKDFDKLFQGEIGKARDYAYRNIDKLFPEEPWAQMLKARLDATKGFLEQYRDMMAETGDLTAQLHKDAAKQIRDNMAAALPEAQRERAQLKNQRDDEIEDMKKRGYALEDERKLEDSINAKYDRIESDRRNARLKSIKSSGVDEYNIFKQIRDNLLTLQKEGLDKEVQRLENQRADELHNAEKAGKKRGELIASINAKYDKIIEDKKNEWYKNQLKQRKAFDDEMIKMAQEAAAELSEIQNTASLNAINRGLEQNENTNIKRTATISYDTSIDASTMSFEDNDKNLQLQKEYYDKLLKQQSEYIAEKTRLQLEESNENERILKEQAEREYNQRVTSNNEWLEAQKEQQEKYFKDGQVSEEEYHANIQRITDTYNQSQQQTQESYQLKLSEIAKNGEQERDNIVSEGRQEQQSTNAEANQNGIDAIQEYYNEIAEISEREQKANTNRHTGLFNYEKERERLEKVKAGYEKVMAGLEADYEKLKARYNAGDINFDQFQAAKKQIEDLKKAAEKSAEDTSESLSDLFQNYAQSVNDFASKIASQFQEMFSTFQNIQSLMLEAEQNQLDQEQEVLDKQKDAVEKAYEKQAAIVDKYKEAINGTEDELKNARGARREALIQDTIEQREAYLKETESLKRQELEKEKIAQKEQQLKKKQDDLEKKRKQQQQKASIVNATINTALGVTQALASWPPPASYALAAAVGALGAVEIALIASQKYAKGGLLSGPSHEHGGITLGYSRGVRQEAEGGEFITDKATTGYNLGLMEFINMKKRRLNLDDFIEFYSGKAKGTKRSPLNYYADGGTMPELTDYSQMVQNQPVQVELSLDSKVSVVDIINATDRVTQTRVLAGL